MRHRLSGYASLAVMLLFACAFLAPGAVAQDESRRPVDIKSDRIFPVPVGDTSGYALTGNVILYHNGAVITCDSMVRYDSRHMECFGNVLLNKDSLYIYGDRLEYDGDRNLASVYAPLVKMTDGNATLYTFFFAFNTKENAGRYWGGGTVSKEGYLMESRTGYYYADTRRLVGVGDVLMRDTTYLLSADSVSYSLDTDIASFDGGGRVWNSKGEFLKSLRGEYHNREDRYRFFRNAYILSEQSEVWADSLDYRAADQDIELWGNIQMYSQEDDAYAFGEYAFYTDSIGKGLMTGDPQFVKYDAESADTLYMRADTVLIYRLDSLGFFELTRPADSLALLAEADGAVIPSAEAEAQEADRADSQSGSVLSETGDAEPDADLSSESDDVSGQDESGHEEDLQEENAVAEEVSDELPAPGNEAEEAAVTASDADSPVAQESAEEQEQDPSETDVPDDTGDDADTDATLEETADPEAEDKDDYTIIAYPNVRIFRTDFQAVCDSLTAFTLDSTAVLYISPILWNESNQIASEQVDIATERQQLRTAVFTGDPIMSAKVDSVRFNQVAGTKITASFIEGEIRRTDVVGNARAYYYLVDDSDATVQGLLNANASDITFLIEDNKVDRIVFRTDPEYVIYPMDQIPGVGNERMDKFVWYTDGRPTRESVFTRLMRESLRERYGSQERPGFRITESIESFKASGMRDGSWEDRSDVLSDETLYFISTRPE